MVGVDGVVLVNRPWVGDVEVGWSFYWGGMVGLFLNMFSAESKFFFSEKKKSEVNHHPTSHGKCFHGLSLHQNISKNCPTEAEV